MKRFLSFLACLLLILSLALPVFATEAQWEAPSEETGQIAEDWDNIPLEKIEGVPADIGAVDGESVITYGEAVPATRESSRTPAWILVVLLTIFTIVVGSALAAGLVILVIVLIVKASRKKKENTQT